MIPPFANIGSVWRVLPPGIHVATIKEVERRFATDTHRKRLFDGFWRATGVLRAARCRAVYLDGSFVTEKPNPVDFDACWDSVGVDSRKLDPVLLDFSNARQAQKKKYFGELFPASALAGPGCFFLDFFQIDRHTGKSKGILWIRL